MEGIGPLMQEDRMHGQGQIFNINRNGEKSLVTALFIDGKAVEKSARVIDAEGGYYQGEINAFFEPDGLGVYKNDRKQTRLQG